MPDPTTDDAAFELGRRAKNAAASRDDGCELF
jgi:hypothetical protein